MLSSRRAAEAALDIVAAAQTDDARRGAQVWLSELVWREFYAAILYHYPQVLTGPFRPEMAHMEWRKDEAGFDAWRQGVTGYPIVDAGMRQLVGSGWMHNRVRMITASFLVKDLLINWQLGEAHFMSHLVDGDPASNNGGWQWVAGTGTDAAPFFRVFNPVSQGRKFDPDGEYVRKWVPELRRLPRKHIHAPWEAPDEMLRAAETSLGRDYPLPIVDHAVARHRALNAHKQARSGALDKA
jgi:deoxyribodipyrimidine photo-lyase